MSPDRPVTLYKYTDSYGAKKILENCTLKLSSPLAFNDPFDMHLGAALGMKTREFTEGLKSAFHDFVSGDISYEQLRPVSNRDLIILINTAIKAAPEHI